MTSTSHGDVRSPSFLIVGTARSGTTLVQRLATELAGVAVPAETHFFSHFAEDLVARQRFPLDRVALDDELRRYTDMDIVGGIDLDRSAVVDALGGSCPSAFALFAAIVEVLGGAAPVLGEKTPAHLIWWEPLTTAFPRLRLVGVVRDPRAVVSSYLAAPFGMARWETVAERWAADQRQLALALCRLGPARCLVLRYEDVVVDPDGARSRLAEHLGVPAGSVSSRTGALGLAWESWKAGADADISSAPVDAWRGRLGARTARAVAAVTREGMEAFGYGSEAPDGRAAALALLTVAPTVHWRRVRYRRVRHLRERRIVSLLR